MEAMSKVRAKKRLFLGLAVGTLSIFGIILYVCWYLFATRRSVILSWFVKLAGWAAFALIIIGLTGLLILAISFFSSRPLGVFRNFTFKILNAVYPLSIGLSRTLHLDSDMVRRSYIEVNNQATKFMLKDIPLSRIMILAPHCLQKSDCANKITMDVNNCRRCGQCPIGDLIRLSENYGAKLSVVTGGTIARDCVKKYQPEVVVAIACERDLVSGIQDVMPLPVIGILNIRPNGPCYNTGVDFAEVESVLLKLQRRLCFQAPQKYFVRDID